MKLASYGGSVDVLTPEEKNNPYFLQPLVGAHAELQSKDRKSQADASKTWTNALAGLKTQKDILAYLTQHKITDDEHLRNYLAGTAESFVNGRKPDPEKGMKGSPRLVGTYALEIQRGTDEWLDSHRDEIAAAFEAKDKLNVGSEIKDPAVERAVIEKAFREGSIGKDEAKAALAQVKKLPDALALARKMKPEEILSAASPEIIVAGLRLQEISGKDARRAVSERLKAGTLTADDADRYLAKIDRIAPLDGGWILESTPNTSGKRYNPKTLQEIK
jgi:hypothetical protein